MKYTVLLVDDDPRLTANLVEFVPWDELNFSPPLIAHCGREAVSRVSNAQVDLVITDLSMPGMGGIELLRQIRAFGCRTRFIILSGYGTFEYAREAIELQVRHFLTKPTDLNELISAVASVREELDAQSTSDSLLDAHAHALSQTLSSTLESLFNDLQNGGSAPLSLEYLLKQIDARFDSGFYALLRVRISPRPNRIEETTAYLNMLLQFTTERMRIRYFRAKRSGCNQYLLVNFDFDQQLCDMVEEVYRTFSSEKACPLCFGLSQIHNSLDALDHCFQEADQAVLDAMSSGSCFRRFNPPQAKKTQDTDPVDALMKTDDEEVRQNLLRSILGENASAGEAIKLLMLIVRCLEREGGTPVIPLGQRAYEAPYRLPSGLPVLEWTANILRYLDRDKAFHADSANARLMARAKSYIHTHYAVEISLESISRKLNISPNYFSRIFREISGVRYIDYITAVRLTKSLEILTQDKIPIYAVSEKVGYGNPKYFSQLFNAAIGCTPSEFRQKNGMESLE